ncbi:MAG: helix-turn-helix domain-containing protein [Spirochaetia bacterium]|jgi:transcriptional regulator with XRE-family HTH domain|nr:helix-turn-helix domain-containing protein [Spirochaetia bacterium]
MTINQRIKQVRNTLNLSQIRFAKGIYLSNGYYAGIELDNYKANNRIVELVASKYGVSRHWLETGEGKMFDREPPDRKLEQMISLFRELNPPFQDFLFDVMGKLIKLQNAGTDKKGG